MRPRYVAIIVVIHVVAISCTLYGQVKVTYIANEGVMVESRGVKVLMDPFFKVGFGLYQVLPIGNMDDLLATHPELGHADVILVSHRHMDHIDPGLVAAYMKKNSQTTMLSSAQASDSVVN